MTTSGTPQPLGMSDFFALEAGEYLDRLDALLQAPATPPADELVRLARALRGSALMASQQSIARAAMGFEALARGVREGRRPWDVATKQIATRAVDDLKLFVRRAGSWTEADTAKAEALGAQLEQMGGRPSAQVRAAEAMGLDAGARAFVAREGAAIGSALDRAGRVLRTNPMAHDPLQHVLKALQPLRGLAALNDLPPLPDLLEGIERAIGELSRTSGVGPSAATNGEAIAELFQMAATSIAQAAREAVSSGVAVNQPALFAAELRRAGDILSSSGGAGEDEAAGANALAAITTALRRIGGSAVPPAEPPVVPIESLAPLPARPAPALSTPADRARGGTESSADIAGSWMVYQRMVSAGVGPASLEELIRDSVPANGGAVDINTLLYKGDRARQRVQELRESAKRASGDALRAIIDEACDLVVLAIEPEQ